MGCREMVGERLGDGIDRRTMIIADAAQAEAHHVEGLGEGQGLAERFLKIGGELEAAVKGSIGTGHGKNTAMIADVS